MNKKLFSVLAMLVLVCLVGCNDEKQKQEEVSKSIRQNNFTPSPNKSWKF